MIRPINFPKSFDKIQQNLPTKLTINWEENFFKMKKKNILYQNPRGNIISTGIDLEAFSIKIKKKQSKTYYIWA